DAFVEGFATKRDARTAVDRNGVDRDTTTYGGNVGVQLDIADRIKGDLGLGVYRAEYQDATISDHTGFSASGRIVWRPRVRTSITGQVFSGDVATIRGGASSRTDTSGSIRVDQEVRHNLLAYALVGVVDTSYRGASGRNLTTLTGAAGVEYLMNRSISIKLDTAYMDRSANLPTDAFNKFRVGVALRLRY
ncbi:outer membrane beta-barrel protein, partial [Sphingomonas sp. LaA6.9]|uniref:outer membrane beta-barrel protein n=1 Tax=Sphingomonas sp. LaA6.9 TaxID=2919914 RepID=UPI001F4F893E